MRELRVTLRSEREFLGDADLPSAEELADAQDRLRQEANPSPLDLLSMELLACWDGAWVMCLLTLFQWVFEAVRSSLLLLLLVLVGEFLLWCYVLNLL